MKKALVFYNPKSGRQKREYRRRQITRALQAIGIDPKIINVREYFYGRAEVAADDYQIIIAVGGDGTIRLAANWILKNNPEIPLGIIPMGTGNLFSESIGVPQIFEKAVETIEKNHAETIDVGLVNNDNFFVLSFSFGHMAEVVGRTKVKEKRRIGFWAYLKEFILRRIRLWEFDFEVDGKRFNIKGNNFFIFNAIRFMGLTPAKKFDFQDGILDAFITTNRTFFGWLISALSLLIFKKPPEPIIFTTTGKEFKVFPKQSKKIKAQLDGDCVELESAVVKVVPSALKIITNK